MNRETRSFNGKWMIKISGDDIFQYLTGTIFDTLSFLIKNTTMPKGV
jgi:hypothetical protein